MCSSDLIPIDSALSQLGVDSLMATEFQLQLDGKLGLSVSIMELLGDVTIRSLSRQSLKTLLVPGGGVAPAMTAVV